MLYAVAGSTAPTVFDSTHLLEADCRLTIEPFLKDHVERVVPSVAKDGTQQGERPMPKGDEKVNSCNVHPDFKMDRLRLAHAATGIAQRFQEVVRECVMGRNSSGR